MKLNIFINLIKMEQQPLNNKIRVIVRVRPFLEEEVKAGDN